jgi:hypothetical protein
MKVTRDGRPWYGSARLDTALWLVNDRDRDKDSTP